MTELEISLFGNLHITMRGVLVTTVDSPRLRSLLAWLLLKANTPQPREFLACLLWPESASSQARTNLRQLLHHLKRALPAASQVLEGDYSNVYWKPDASCSIDVANFQTAIVRAAKARRNQDPLREIQYLEEAAELYVDDLLPALYDEWIVPLREELRAQLASVLQRLASLLDKHGRTAAAISYANKLVAHDAINENSYYVLIKLHVANGDRASAIQVYRRCRTLLRRELAVQPGPELSALFESILRVKPSALPQSLVAKQRSEGPLIGRLVEMRCLERAKAVAVAERVQAVMISGEPGIGKTRLADDFLKRAECVGHAVVRSRCHSGQGQVAYAPVAEWLRSETLRAGWTRLTLSQRRELARIVPEIAESYTASDPLHNEAERWQKSAFHNALLAAFMECSRPLFLFLDDLQWCDAESLQWLQLLINSSGAGLLLVATVRAEETGRDHPFRSFALSMRQSGVMVEVPLQALDVTDTVTLAHRESAEPLTPEKLHEIYESTKGNPLFVVESVRAGLQSPRIQAVISARLARLSPAAHELAGVASIIGGPFSIELLERASDNEERSLTHALEELWQSRILEVRDRTEYNFTHERIRDVARMELSPVRLRYLHRRVARALTEPYGTDLHEWKGQIAFHYEQAGMVEQAVRHLCSAADFARHRFSYTESAKLLRQASTLLGQLPESVTSLQLELEVRRLLGAALVTTEGYSAPEVGATYQRALDLSRRFEEANVFPILSGSWVFHVVHGEVETSRQEAMQFLQAAEKTSSSELKLAGSFLLGSSLSHLGQFQQAFKHLKLALKLHQRSSASVLEVFGAPDVRAFCRAYLSHVAWHRAPNAEDESATLFITEALHMAEAMGNPFIQAIALNYCAMLHVLRGDGPRALSVGRQAVELCDRHSFAYYLAMANVLTGWATCAVGAPEVGLEQLRSGLHAMRELGAELRMPYYCALLAECYGLAGKTLEASANLATGFGFADKNGEAWTLPELHRVQGDLLIVAGKPAQATISYRRALAAAQQCGSLAFERRGKALLQKAAAAGSVERS